MPTDITKLFAVHNLSKVVKNRLNEFKSLNTTDRTILQYLNPWLVIADLNFNIVYNSELRKPQVDTSYFMGEMDVISFNTDTDQSSPLFQQGTLNIKFFNKQLFDNPKYNFLLIPGSDVIIIIGHSDVSAPSTKNEVENYVTLSREAFEEKNKNKNILAKYALFEMKVTKPSITLNSDSTVDIVISLFTAQTFFLTTTTVDSEDIKSFVESFDTDTTYKNIGVQLIDSIDFRNGFEQLKNETKADWRGVRKYSITESGLDYFYNIICKKLTYTIDRSLIAEEVNSDSVNISSSKLKRLTSSIKGSGTYLIRISDFIKILNYISIATSIGDKKNTLNFKIESYNNLNNTIIDSSLEPFILSLTEEDIEEIKKEQYAIIKIVKDQLYKRIVSGYISTNLQDILIPVDLLKLDKETLYYNDTQQLKLTKYLSIVLNRINEFYNNKINKIDLDFRIDSDSVILFEKKTQDTFARNNINIDDIPEINLFEDQGIIKEHSITMEMPTTDFMGVVITSGGILPCVRSNQIQKQDFLNLVDVISTNVSELIKIEKFINETHSSEVKLSNIGKIIYTIWKNRSRNVDTFDIEDTYKVKQNCSSIINLILKYCIDKNNRNDMWYQDVINEAPNTMRAITTLYKNITSTPLYDLFINSMFNGTITLPGIGNVYQYQRFLLRTGINLYDKMQGLIKNTDDRIFYNVITGVSHTIDTSGWTTQINFRKDAVVKF